LCQHGVVFQAVSRRETNNSKLSCRRTRRRLNPTADALARVAAGLPSRPGTRATRQCSPCPFATHPRTLRPHSVHAHTPHAAFPQPSVSSSLFDFKCPHPEPCGNQQHLGRPPGTSEDCATFLNLLDCSQSPRPWRFRKLLQSSPQLREGATGLTESSGFTLPRRSIRGVALCQGSFLPDTWGPRSSLSGRSRISPCTAKAVAVKQFCLR
jgi:hypothetical protein